MLYKIKLIYFFTLIFGFTFISNNWFNYFSINVLGVDINETSQTHYNRNKLENSSIKNYVNSDINSKGYLFINIFSLFLIFSGLILILTAFINKFKATKSLNKNKKLNYIKNYNSKS